MASPWRFVPTDLFGRPLGEMHAFERQLTLGISQMGSAAARIRTDDPLWPAIAAGLVNLKVYDSTETLRLYGPVISDEEEADGTLSNVKITAADLSWGLSKRFVGKDPQGIGTTYTQIDTGSIAMNLLAAVNGERPTGIVEGIGGSGGGGVNVFGRTTPGGSDNTNNWNQNIGNQGQGTPIATKFTLAEPASLQKISWYLKGVPAATSGVLNAVPYQAALYKADGASGRPGTRVALSAPVNVNEEDASARWVDFTVTATLTPGDYWMALSNNGVGNPSDPGMIAYFETVANSGIRGGGGLTNPFAGGSLTSKQYTAYTTYQVISASPFAQTTVTYLWRPVLDALNELAALGGSFEWSLRYDDGAPPTVHLDLFGLMGADRTNSVFLEYGFGKNNCGHYSRVRSIDTQATRVWAIGEGGTKVSPAYDTGSELLYQARREDVVSFSDITIPQLLDSLSAAHVAVRKDPRSIIQLDPRRNVLRYGADYEIGDRVTARAKVNGVPRVNGAVRIWSVSILIDELGNETPSLTLVPD